MKRSKIFLGITTALLGIAGVAAAKHFIKVTTRFYLSVNKKYCYISTEVQCTQAGALTCLYQTAGLHNVIVFTKGPAGVIPTGSTVCTTQFYYNGVK